MTVNKNIEVEIRSFISQAQYEQLLRFFKSHAILINKDDQETFYFDAQKDLRIQRNNFFAKVWLKEGKIHDEEREEIEIRFDKNDFPRLEKLFKALGYKICIKWLRKRYTFKWKKIDVMLDYTKGYGYIIELEKMSSKGNADKVLKLLQQKMKGLQILPSPKDEFDKKYVYYKDHWKKLLQ